MCTQALPAVSTPLPSTTDLRQVQTCPLRHQPTFPSMIRRRDLYGVNDRSSAHHLQASAAVFKALPRRCWKSVSGSGQENSRTRGHIGRGRWRAGHPGSRPAAPQDWDSCTPPGPAAACRCLQVKQLVKLCSALLRCDSLQNAHVNKHRDPRRIGALAALQAWQQLAAVCKSHILLSSAQGS